MGRASAAACRRGRRGADRAVDGPELLAERAGVVGQPVAVADVAHAGRDLGVAAGGQVGVEVVLDLEAQVAGEQMKERAAVDVRRAEQLPRIPATRVSSSTSA